MVRTVRRVNVFWRGCDYQSSKQGPELYFVRRAEIVSSEIHQNHRKRQTTIVIAGLKNSKWTLSLACGYSQLQSGGSLWDPPPPPPFPPQHSLSLGVSRGAQSLPFDGWRPYPQATLSLPSSKSTFSQPFGEKCIREVVGIGSIIIFHLSKLWKASYPIILCVIFLVRLKEKFEIDHSCEWKG